MFLSNVILILVVSAITTTEGQQTTCVQSTGCQYKLVPQDNMCSTLTATMDEPQHMRELEKNISTLLWMVVNQAQTINHQQEMLNSYDRQLQNISKYLESVKELTSNSREVGEKYQNLSSLEDKVQKLEGLLVDLEGEGSCSKLLVSGENPIQDGAITASSSWDNSNHRPAAVRIYTVTVAGSWATKFNNGNQWIKFDLGLATKVTGVITKGRHTAHSQFVRTYKVYYSMDNLAWEAYKDKYGQDKIFTGNFDAETVRKNILDPTITARYVRIHPVTWFTHISMRIDLLGCDVP